MDENSESDNCGCFLFKCKRAKIVRNRKDSIVYFQANDDLENNPHNLLYDSTSSTQSNLHHQQQQQQQQQLLLSANSSNIYQSNLESNRNLIRSQATFSPVSTSNVPESFVSLSFKNNNDTNHPSYIQNNNNIMLPQFQSYQIKNSNCHTNKAAAFYYDYSTASNSIKNELASGSSKYSFQSSTLSSAIPKFN